MKARASLFPVPDPTPDVEALGAHYRHLVMLVMTWTLAGNFGEVLKASLDAGRAARALIKAKIRARQDRTRADMLACAGWRAKVISDLGGLRKLALWQAAMKRAVSRERGRAQRWTVPVAPPPKTYVTPQMRAAGAAEALRRARIRDCARACAHPGVFKDPFRVDQDGLFRLPPLPREARTARAGGRRSLIPVDYAFDARKTTGLSGALAPAMVWPIEFYRAQARDIATPEPPPVFALGRTPGQSRRPARQYGGRARRRALARIPNVKRVFAPP